MKKVIIMGAAGRDFHNFNVCFRDDPDHQVVAFTAAQIPGIDNRIYPQSLAGAFYKDGIPIVSESELKDMIIKHEVDEVIFSYSDVEHEYVMHKASLVLAAGADFRLLGPGSTMLKSRLPVISVTANRTGSGKSQVSRYIGTLLKSMGKKPIIVRHPMPYGILEEQVLERLANFDDLARFKCTIEEREEYEPHIEAGLVVYAGVDYGKILDAVEEEGDIIIWDGGNNDFPFFKADLKIVVLDPLRIGDETRYYPGETNLLMADVVIINKVNSADSSDVERLVDIIRGNNPGAEVLLTNSDISVEDPDMIKGKKVVVIEDGPTLTHGQRSFGAGMIAARKFEAGEIIDPRPFAVGSLKDTFSKWKQIGDLIPAMGYSKKQISELETTINNIPADLVIVGTPIDLGKILKLNKDHVRVRYDLEELTPRLAELLKMTYNYTGE